jgi:hypothetical protein
VEHWAQLKLQYLADPDLSETYMTYAHAATWSPDDPRLVDLAHKMAAARLASRSEGGEIDFEELESAHPTTIALIADRFAAVSPAMGRLLELTEHEIRTWTASEQEALPQPAGLED